MSESDATPRSQTSRLDAATPEAAWLCDPKLRRVFDVIQTAGYEARAVGGVVRDALLGVTDRDTTSTDIDLATNARPDAIISAAKSAGLNAVPTGLAHGTITIVVDGTPFEVTTLRTDVTTDGRHATVAFTDDWTEDAKRRDFTMNAIYCDADGTVFDPVGGISDIAARRLTFIGDPDARIREDYLRILRFFRFQAQLPDLAVRRDDLVACARGRRGLAQLSSERVGIEILKLLDGSGAQMALRRMFDYGVLTQTLGLAPSLARAGALDRALQDCRRPLADAGFDRTTAIIRLFALGVRTEADIAHLTARLRLSKAQRDLLQQLQSVMSISATYEALQSQWKVLAWRYGKAAIVYALIVRAADSIYAGRDLGDIDLSTDITEIAAFDMPAFPVTGKDLIAKGMSQGPELGTVLAKLTDDWLKSEFSLTREMLLDRAKDPEVAAHASPGRLSER